MADASRFRPTLLCPLEFERKAISDWWRGRPEGVAAAGLELHVCGPGPAGVRRWFDAFGGTDERPGGMLLVGTAGGLDPTLAAGTAILASRILDAHDRAWTPTLRPPGEVRDGAILSLERAVTAAAEKHRHHARSGAVAIDLESATFAECCTSRSWRWNVLRGISDAADHPLPPQVADWIDARGRVRHAALLASLARTPRTIALLPGLRRRSLAALRTVAAAVAAWAASGESSRDGMASRSQGRASGAAR